MPWSGRGLRRCSFPDSAVRIRTVFKTNQSIGIPPTILHFKGLLSKTALARQVHYVGVEVFDAYSASRCSLRAAAIAEGAGIYLRLRADAGAGHRGEHGH